ncbi:stomatin-like isoform 3-T3 [Liasis olivaceus]
MSKALRKREESVESETLEGGKSEEDIEDDLAQGEWFLLVLSLVCLILTFPFSVWLCLQVVNEYEEPVIMRLGHIRKNVARGPDTLIKVDMRTKTFDMPFQEIFTKDPLIIDVDGVVYYRVQNAPLAVTKVTNADSATHLLAKAIMKNTLGAQNLCHIISERDKVAKDIQALLDNVTGDWGVKIERVEIKNVKTRVNVVAPRNMMPQPKPVKEASILLQESPLSLQLHYLKADGAHSGQPNSTIIFSYP